MNLSVITGPAAMPIDLAEARLQIKQDITEDDPLLAIYIRAARNTAESWCERTLVATRWRLQLDAFPCGALVLPRGPLLQVVSITYLDMGGVVQTLAPSEYVLDNSGPLPRITPPFGSVWPVTLPQIGAIAVQYDAGYIGKLKADATADTVALTGWKTLVVGDVLRVSNSGGVLPAPLEADIDYFVSAVVSAGVYRIAATLGGADINITTTGFGSQFVGTLPDEFRAWMLARVCTSYEHRGEASVIKGTLAPLPYIDRLLDSVRVVEQ